MKVGRCTYADAVHERAETRTHALLLRELWSFHALDCGLRPRDILALCNIFVAKPALVALYRVSVLRPPMRSRPLTLSKRQYRLLHLPQFAKGGV